MYSLSKWNIAKASFWLFALLFADGIIIPTLVSSDQIPFFAIICFIVLITFFTIVCANSIIKEIYMEYIKIGNSLKKGRKNK